MKRKIVEVLRNRRGVADVFIGFIAGAILFALFYMIFCYLGYVHETYIEPAVNITEPNLKESYDVIRQGYVDYLKTIPALFFISFIFYAVYRHFTEVSRGKRVR